MTPPLIVLAGGTGNLGHRIAAALVARGAAVRALVRPSTEAGAVAKLSASGASVVSVDFADLGALTEVCAGAECVVSALSGLRPVIVEVQGYLLDAAVAADVPRFIPSDFSIDYTPLKKGTNRNFDLRREFRARLDAAPIRATSIFNGAFADMLNGQVPIVIRPLRRVVYWNRADLALDFTTMDDTAMFTAAAALDAGAPRNLHVAGERTDSGRLAEAASAATGQRFRVFRAGSLWRLGTLIGFTRGLFPQDGAVFPAWQGMQYLHNMFSGEAGSPPLDNDRYPGMHWTTVRQVLARG